MDLKTAFIDKITINIREGRVSNSYLAIKEYYKVPINNKEISKISAFKYYYVY